ncbi:MAG: TIGR03545 family protein [FCB group bacterium]|nr:TIGR03545 family protein [FCB group bacterium]
MRKKGFALLGFAALLFIVLPYLFLGAWVENSLEEYASSVNGAKVEIENLSLSLLHPSMKWSRLQIADRENTSRNILETGECRISFDLLPLLEGKFSADEFKVRGLRFNTSRSSSGALTPAQTSASSGEPEGQSGTQTLQPSKLFRKINTDSLLAEVKLTSPEKMDSIKQTYSADMASLQKQIDQLPDTAELDSARAELKRLRLKDIKTLDDAKAALDKIAQIYAKLDKTGDTITSLQNEVKQKYAELRELPSSIRDWTAADYQNIKQFSGDTFSRKSATTLLLGPEISRKIERTEKIVRGVRQFYQKYHQNRPPKEKPPRGAGQTIHFSNRRGLPTILIRRIELSGLDNTNREFTGSIENLTTDQNLVGAVTTFLAVSRQDADTSLTFSAVLDYRDLSKRESADLIYRGLSLKGMEFDGGTLLPHRFSNGSADISAQFNFDGEDYTGTLDAAGSNIEFDFGTLDSAAQDARRINIITETAAAMKNIRLHAVAEKRGPDRSLNITSNVDDLIADKLATIIGGSTDELDQAITQRVQSNRKKYGAVIDSLKSTLGAKASAPLTAKDADLKDVQKLLKEKRAQLQQELTKKQGDLLKNLFH